MPARNIHIYQLVDQLSRTAVRRRRDHARQFSTRHDTPRPLGRAAFQRRDDDAGVVLLGEAGAHRLGRFPLETPDLQPVD